MRFAKPAVLLAIWLARVTDGSKPYAQLAQVRRPVTSDPPIPSDPEKRIGQNYMFIVPEQNEDGQVDPGWLRKRVFIAADSDFLLLALVSTKSVEGDSDTDCIWGFRRADDLDALIRGILQGDGRTAVTSISILIPPGKNGPTDLRTETVTRIHERTFLKSYKVPDKQYIFYTDTGSSYHSDNNNYSGLEFGRDIYVSKKYKFA